MEKLNVEPVEQGHKIVTIERGTTGNHAAIRATFRSDFECGNGAGRVEQRADGIHLCVAAPRTGWPRSGRRYLRLPPMQRKQDFLLDGSLEEQVRDALTCVGEHDVSAGGGFRFTSLPRGTEADDHTMHNILLSKQSWQAEFMRGCIREILPDDAMTPRFPGGWYYFRVEVQAQVPMERECEHYPLFKIHVHNMRQSKDVLESSCAGEEVGGYRPWYRFRGRGSRWTSASSELPPAQRPIQISPATAPCAWSSWRRWPVVAEVRAETKLFAGPERSKISVDLRDLKLQHEENVVVEIAHSVPFSVTDILTSMDRLRLRSELESSGVFFGKSDTLLPGSCDGQTIPTYVIASNKNARKAQVLLAEMERRAHRVAGAASCATRGREGKKTEAHAAASISRVRSSSSTSTCSTDDAGASVASSSEDEAERGIGRAATDALKGVKTAFFSARCHPGESAASFAFDAFVSSLVSSVSSGSAGSTEKNSTAAADLTDSSWIFVLVPCVNPDGVARGHFRCNAAGHDLNRVYDLAISSRRPGTENEIAKTQNHKTDLFDAVPGLVQTVWPTLAELTDFQVYVDFHSFENGCAGGRTTSTTTSRSSGSYIYYDKAKARENEISKEDLQVHKSVQSRFKIRGAKEKNGGSGRAVAGRFARHAYTLESYSGEDPERWRKDGETLLRALLHHHEPATDR